MTALDPQWLTVARQELGQLEIPGPQSNHRILEYHQACTLKAGDDDVPWCSAFLNWTLKTVGIPGTASAAALSWISWGVRIDAPIVGAVGVIDHGGGKGHVTFIVGRDASGDNLICLGGNQNNAVRLSGFPRVKFASFRWPALPIEAIQAQAGTR